MTEMFIAILVAFIIFCLAEAYAINKSASDVTVDPHIWDDLDEPAELEV